MQLNYMKCTRIRSPSLEVRTRREGIWLGFDLLTNYVDDLEALIRRTRAKLKKVLALKSEDNHIR